MPAVCVYCSGKISDLKKITESFETQTFININIISNERDILFGIIEC